jgi:NodT family efflux transporter outer membrane factor (OMF) lipoprotein
MERRAALRVPFAARHAAAVVAAVVFVVGGCNVGPDYEPPSAPLPDAWKEAGAPGVGGEWRPARPGDETPRGKWWEAYQDERLNAFEEQLAQSNQDLIAAAAGVRAAKALIQQARAQYFPQVSLDPSVIGSRVSTGFGKELGTRFTTYTLPVDATWELDLWGRVANTVKANTSAAEASIADLESVRLSQQAELASDYFELRGQDALQAILDAAVVAYQEQFDLNRALLVSGMATDEAVAQAEAQLESTRAQATSLGLLRAQYEHAIALLTGVPASSLSIPTEPLEPQPPPIPTGLPSDLLQRRPDVAAAERRVAQANAEIGIATAAYYPNVTLSASAGFQSASFSDWLSWSSRMWSVGPSLAQSLFDAGLRRAAVRQFRAVYDERVAEYRQTVLAAFQEVEDQLAALRLLARTIEQQDAAVAAARRALDEAQTRYQSGLDPYLNVITAQAVLLANQQAAATFRRQRMVASVQLVKALGGDWSRASIAASLASDS